jgi:DNA-binding beta-propeller fold protein YncE
MGNLWEAMMDNLLVQVVAVDLSGNVYVTDAGNSRIQVFAPS